MRKEDKVTVIEQLASVVQEYPHFYLTNIEALNAKKTSALRKECFKRDVKLVVVKNTLLKKALENLTEVDYSPLYASLKGNTAVMFSHVANVPAKLIKDFTKDIKGGDGKPQLKAAYVQESFYVGAENLGALVDIKSKDELIGDVIALLQSPAKNVISALQSSAKTIHGVLTTLAER